MEPGTLIGGRFELERVMRASGMSTVYRARDRARSGPVAVKVISGLEPHLAERFSRECSVLEALQHPAIVRYVAHGEAPGGARYLAMEWLEGQDLSERLSQGPLSPKDTLQLARRVAEAVGAAHARGVVHRDIKPSNVFLVDGRVDAIKVLDFGIAALIHGRASKLTRTGVAVGTPGYMPPEQARGEAPVDPRADVYALGCVLFHALAGRGPFESRHFMAALVKSVMEATPRVRDIAPEVPGALDALVHRMMAKDPEDRFPDARGVLEAIAQIGDLQQGELPTRPLPRPSLTKGEQRVSTVVLLSAYPPGASDPNAITREAKAPRTRDDVRGRSREAARIAGEYGGRFELLLGDALLVTFESDPAPTDQAARAARCALALRSLFANPAIVIATGRRAATMTAAEGEVVHRAVERLELAHDNRDLGPAIFVDETSFGLLEGRFEIFCTPLGHVLIGTQDPLHAERRLLGRVTPCVGRSRELGTLRVLFSEAVSEPAAVAVVLSGPPGIGKTRVRQAFVQQLREAGQTFETWLARGDPIRAGSPFGLVRDLVRAAVGLRGTERAEVCRARLRARVGSHAGPEQAPRIVEFLAELVGAADDIEPSTQLTAARGDPLVMGDQMRRAFEDLLDAVTATQPVLLVLEDLQWGDAASIGFVDAVLRNLADKPILVLATARPEAEESFGRLWSDRGAQEIRVGPLSPRASRALVSSAAEDTAEALVDRLVDRAGGHPLVLEEMLRAFRESSSERLPDTALALVETRLLALDEEARRVLRAASIFGRTFWAGGVAALTSGDEVPHAQWLELLAGTEWIVARPNARFEGEQEYAFAQDLVRDAAYAMLMEEDRELGHRLAGDWLRARGEQDALTLARHAELGGQPRRAAGDFERAAERALDGGDFEATLQHGARALVLGGRGALRGRVRAIRAEAHLHLGAFEPALEESAKALGHSSMLDAGSLAWCRALAVRAQASGKTGDIDAVRAATEAWQRQSPAPAVQVAYAAVGAAATVQLLIGGEKALAQAVVERLRSIEAATERPPPELRGHVAKAVSATLAFGGDPGEALRGLREAVLAFEEAGDARSVCSLRKTQGWYAGECGALEEGERALLEAVSLAERLGLPNLVAHAKFDAGSPLLRLGKLEAARRMLEPALVTFREQGDRRLEAGALGMLAWADMLEGHAERAVVRATRAVDTAPTDPVRIPALAYLATAHLVAGDAARAHAVAGEGRSLLAAVGVTEEGTALLGLTYAEAAQALGHEAESRAVIAEAAAQVRARAEKIGDAGLRKSFLTRISEHRRILELAAP